MGEGQGTGFSLREAGDRLGIAARQVRRYVRDGRLPAVLVHGPRGPEYRISAEDLDKLEASRSARKGSVQSGGPWSLSPSEAQPSPEAIHLASEQLAALERAWERVASLERENAELRGRLTAGVQARPLTLRERLTGRLGGGS